VVSGELLARAWAAGAGPGDGCRVIIDDSSIVETYGLAKQGGKFTYSHVRGCHPLVSVIAGTGDVVHCRLRGGNADSGFYSHRVIDACRAGDVKFSITAKLHKGLHTRERGHPPTTSGFRSRTSTTAPMSPRPGTARSGPKAGRAG